MSEWPKPDRWPEEADRSHIPGRGSGPAGVEASSKGQLRRPARVRKKHQEWMPIENLAPRTN